MIYVWLAIGLVIVGISYYWWPADKKSWRTVAATAATFAGFFLIANFIVAIWPVKHIEVREVQKKYVDPPKVIYREKIVYRNPDGEVAPVDVKGACAGKYPLVIQALTVSGKDDDDDRTTWIDATLVGSKVMFTCGQPGDYSNWKPGQIVQIVRGTPQ